MGSSSRTSDGSEPTSHGDVGSLARHASVTYRRGDDAREIDRPWCEASAVELVAAACQLQARLVDHMPTLGRSPVGSRFSLPFEPAERPPRRAASPGFG